VGGTRRRTMENAQSSASRFDETAKCRLSGLDAFHAKSTATPSTSLVKARLEWWS